ncbi:helix-turn-helix transcriptional regulator [Streptomyces sparsogenes]|uniref:helix-turn-helix transcriptional regulator n=1 Tax=Streptomyces sparsogenes TaxID=67365 RepID=UPI003404C526
MSYELVRRAPCRALRGAVLGYQGFRVVSAAPRRRLELPSGCVDLVFFFDGPIRLTDALDPARAASLPCLATGPRTTAAVGEHPGRVRGVQVALTPLAAHTIFDVPMHEIANSWVDPGELLGAGARGLAERLAGCADWGSRFRLLDQVLAARLRAGPSGSADVLWAWRRIQATAGRVTVAELAAATGQSRRHLERGFGEQVGLPPKSVAMVARLQSALRLSETGLPLSQVAAMAGYHDHAHFTRCFRALVGLAPSRFRAARALTRPGEPIDRIDHHITSAVLPG